MRFVVLLIGLPVAIGLSLVSMIANWRFGVRLGAEDGDALVYGLASVCADGMKIILPFAIGWAWRRRRIAEWLSAACLWLVITGYSLVSALSFAAMNRAEMTERKAAIGQQVQDLRADLDAKRRERHDLPSARPVGAVEADIRTSEQSPRWETTRKCTEADNREARTFCERHQRLAAELAVSRRSEKLDQDIAALQAKLDARPSTSTRTIDPQLDLFRNLSGWGEGAVKAALAILVCLLIELGSGLGLFVVLSCFRALGETEPEAMRAPRPTFTIDGGRASGEEWAAVRLMHEPSAMIGAAELYADYRLWVEARDRDNVLTVTAFGRWMSEQGAERDKIGGRIVYRGVRLQAVPKLLAR